MGAQARPTICIIRTQAVILFIGELHRLWQMFQPEEVYLSRKTGKKADVEQIRELSLHNVVH